ncbi:MAG: HEPN domain-containing protein [Anaerolineae bacterium]|nr:HEPN domain-containing protein [Anaerolineae bacterium]MDH7473010.1 HEPN domain-containing protein [Anaerolineae bacterium]
MRREPLEEARRWLTHAQDEFGDAEELRLRGRFYLALFHFQQATEKALKAYLYSVVPSEEVFLTHSIYELLQRAEEADSDFEQVRRAASLDQYYIPTRYPNGLPGGVPSRFYTDPDEARRAMELSSMVLEMVAGKLGGP